MGFGDFGTGNFLHEAMTLVYARNEEVFGLKGPKDRVVTGKFTERGTEVLASQDPSE